MWAIQRAIFRRIHGTVDVTVPKLSSFSVVSPKNVEVEYADGSKFNFSAEFQRIHSPAADGKVRSIGGEKGMRIPRILEVWKLGSVNYVESLKLQERLVTERKAHRIPDTLLSLQHPPTYTLGKRRTDHNLLIPESELTKIGAELHYTQRGGDITFHGPSQAILYPIISLRDMGIGARSYVERLESSMIELASIYGVKARAGHKGETGVWVGDQKIGAIGVRISYGITSHGLAFNINPDLSYFKHIVPCGIADKEVTSLRRETETKQLIPTWRGVSSH
ncbi:PREDICTED: octanoyltransferase isoform X3 [Tarenaya hassleriana]|uniref:octanoyltransferase isoform X3 n=1 Tax=Tarenaya hassleriana TaxID=28532 RepID=UPI00053C9FC0|nr:PREDICTED: octanoyltransferase isoform X3 [Tarenaya hassleriana]